MGRAARNDLDVAGVLKALERPDDVPPVFGLEVRQAAPVPVLPVAGEVGHMVVAFAPEQRLVGTCRLDFAAQVARQLVLKAGVAKLFDQHGRQAQGDFGRQALGDQPMADVQQGQVRLCRRLG